MEESKRQKQIGRVLAEELNDIFRRKGWGIIGNGMVSISHVTITPDLFEARIYLSMFQIDNPATLLQEIKEHDWEIRKELGMRIKNQVRNIPTLAFFIDDTLDYVQRIDEVLKKIKDKEKKED